jgi:hypothetical protein
LLYAQFRIFWIGLELLIDLHQADRGNLNVHES